MGNFVNKKLDLRLTNSEYYDYYLVNPEIINDNSSSACYAVSYDFNNPETFNNSNSIDTIYSIDTWSGATNTGYTFDTFGLTALDNGVLVYNQDSGDTKNIALVDILTGSTLTIAANDKRLILNRVTGSTQQFVYPIELVNNPEPIGNTVKFCGGFYQGYYKIDNSTYQVLPDRVNKGWVADFYLKKEDSCSGVTGTTLNDIYPENKGFFFYLGTRAENKFWNIFEGNNTGCTIDCDTPSGCTDIVTKFCTEAKETEIQLFDKKSGYDIFLNPPLLDIKEITNQFLIYGRADRPSGNRCGGCGEPLDNPDYGKETVCSFTGNSITVANYVRKRVDDRNQFLIYGRADRPSGNRCGGCGRPKDGDDYGKETVCSYSGDSELVLELDKNLDVYDNAIGFRITDDGRIGYRALKYYCSGGTTGITVDEQYSEPSTILENIWTRVTIRFVYDDFYTDEELKCLPKRKGKLMFYIDCKLKASFKGVDEFVAKRLNDYYAKQIGVPFNISIGGGSQGLIESMTFDGQDSEDLGLLIEQNFAGSFIGEISEFKLSLCDINWIEISSWCPKNCGI
jgi:hypothetical protein